jgi:hypothetical protein
MFKRVAACTFLLAGLLTLATLMAPVCAMPMLSTMSFCGACTIDDDCGTDHKCCQADCPKGKKKCVKTSVCR